MVVCDFCGKNQYEVNKIINNDNVAICDMCVMTCMSVLEKDNKLFPIKDHNDK